MANDIFNIGSFFISMMPSYATTAFCEASKNYISQATLSQSSNTVHSSDYVFSDIDVTNNRFIRWGDNLYSKITAVNTENNTATVDNYISQSGIVTIFEKTRNWSNPV